MLSPEALVVVAYEDMEEGMLLCRPCGEKKGLPCSDALSLYAMQVELQDRTTSDWQMIIEGPDAVYCDWCDGDIYRPIVLEYLREWAD